MRWLCVLGVVLGLTSSASAAEAPQYAFWFVGAPDCADRKAFVRSFEARTTALELVPGDPTSAVAIVLQARGDHTYAQLSIRLDDGRVVERSVEAMSCVEALEAIGFVTALALDPSAVSPVNARAEVPAPTEPPPPLRSAQAPPPPSPSRVSAALGVAPTVSFGATPHPSWGAGIGGEVQLRLSPSWLASFRVVVSHEWSQDFVTSVGTAHFERTLGALDLCPWRAQLGALELVPCVQTTGGVLLAEGQAYSSSSTKRPWGEVGASLLVDFTWGEHVTWSTRGAAGAPWTRDSFQFDDVVFHHVAPIVGTVSSGIYFRFR